MHLVKKLALEVHYGKNDKCCDLAK